MAECNYEFGYTPNNLRAVMNEHGLTAKKLADMFDVHPKSAARWLIPAGKASHRPMNHEHWCKLLETVGKNI